MNEQWMEEIKHNDAVIFLEKYFPGQSFGDKTEQIAELCRIAEKSGFTDSESIRKIVSVQIGGDAIPLHDETIAPDGRRIIGKKYISDADASKSGACKACLEYAGRIFKWPEEKDKMPVLPRHPNCKCHYEDVYEIDKQISKIQFRVHFHVKGSPSLPNILGGSQEFFGLKDLLDKLEKNYPPHSIKYLTISNHGDDDVFDLGNGDDLKHIGNRTSRDELRRLKRMLTPDATLEIRMCQTIKDKGYDPVQYIADIIGCKVIAYRNKVSIAGGKAPRSWKMPDKKIFYPKIDKK